MGASVKNERGQVFVAAAVALAAFLALGVVAVDIGRLAHTATEVQAVADVAASAGATALLKKTFAQANVDPIAEAQFVAGQNTMDGQAAVVTDIALLHYDFASGGFTSGSPNAVRATPSVTVTNLIAGVLGDRQTTVTKCTVSVVPCGSFNQAMTVSGFATVQVLNVSAPGNNGTNPLCTPNANGKTGITLQTICNTDDAGGGGGGNFGTETVAMVE